jgi:hypothetical protein
LNITFYTYPLIFDQDATRNIFDDMPSLAPPKRSDLRDEITAYLSTDPEVVKDVLAWWYEKRTVYPTLYRMALDYLSIPGKQYIIMPCFNTNI